jgi:hypothetical protein
MGLKAIYVDNIFNDGYFEKLRQKYSIGNGDEEFNLLIKSKYTFLAITTLTGVVPLIADIHGTIRSLSKKNRVK